MLIKIIRVHSGGVILSRVLYVHNQRYDIDVFEVAGFACCLPLGFFFSS